MTRLIAALGTVAAQAACGPDRGGRVVSAESGAVDVSIPRPAFTLTDTDGKPFAFAERTAGRLTFLEFGYTNCPDVCPVHMANLSTVLTNLAPSDRMRTTVVFVTVDPDRDSAVVLVFTADDTAHVMYPFGTRQSDWARDIPMLLARRGRGDLAAVALPAPAIERAYVVIPAGEGPAL